MVQLTSGEWAEVKTMVIGEHRQVWQAKQSQIETKVEQISYFAQMAPASEFTEQSLAEWHRRGGEKAKEVVSVSDGALWIQELVTYHRPDAVRVIDFSHAVAYLADVGKAVHGEGTSEFKSWFGAARQQLRHKPPRATLGMLYLLRRQYPDESEIALVIDRAIYYLKRREEMIDYPHFRRKGYPIGSGCVESGHKVVMQRRMKQAGVRWSPACVNPMLALRSLICNDRWDEGWSAIVAYRQQHQRKIRLQRAQPIKPKPPEPVSASTSTPAASSKRTNSTRSRKPAPDHPWRLNKWPVRYR